jgi:hypothetical protein
MTDSAQILTSWKDIAKYLGKGVRTVQRWERELGLPVRRPDNGKHVVVAVSDDLDAWITNLQPRLTSAPCCDCKALLDRANSQIAELVAENAKLRRVLAADSKIKSDGAPARETRAQLKVV